MNKIGVVQREIEKDMFEVALGPIKMRVKRDDFAEVVRSEALRAREGKIRSRRRAGKRECMLR